VLAPYPFYQDRGSPIALSEVLKVLSERGDKIDLVVYHEGENIHLGGLTIHRIPKLSFIKHIRPGFSWKKVICDIFMFFKALNLVLVNRYHVVHAVEESVFIALVLKWLFKIPYIYDMDSSLSQQLVERYPFVQAFLGFFNVFEGLAVRNAIAVVPVCTALADSIAQYQPKKVVILQDFSLLKGSGAHQLCHDCSASDIGGRRVE
jgi:hypothetical protein